ncbi:MAG: Dabb family protein [Janthinobacterium lividum]
MTRIQHTVVFRLVHEAGSAAEAAFLDTARATLPAIPGVEDFTINRQVGAKSDLAWQFSMVFVDAAAYAAYDAHPAHTGFVASRWVPEVAEFSEYDFVAGPAA